MIVQSYMMYGMETLAITIGHDITLVKGQSRLYVRKYSLSQKTANEWNKADCVHTSSTLY